jgi:hypothetical protein
MIAQKGLSGVAFSEIGSAVEETLFLRNHKQAIAGHLRRCLASKEAKAADLQSTQKVA